MADDLSTHGHSKARLRLDPSPLSANFNMRSFKRQHGPSKHELPTMPRLLELTLLTAVQRPANVYYDIDDVGIGQRRSDAPKLSDPVDAVIKRIESASAWIILRRADRRSQYRALMAELLDQATAAAGARATKNISFSEQSDRDVLPEDEIERLRILDSNAPCYNPQLQGRARPVLLRPGTKVHVSVTPPHWPRNGPEPSMSVNINIVHFRRARAHAHRVNYRLHRLGFAPTSPHQSPLLDPVKQPIGTATDIVRWLARRLSRPLR